jgi:NADPH-dependent curcumin reductase CurA
MTNKKIVLTNRPIGNAKESDFELMEDILPTLQDGEIMIRNAYVSLDPAMRGWMNAGTTYIPGVAIGDVMRAFAAGTVIESNHPNFTIGDTVQGLLGVQQYVVHTDEKITKVDATAFPLQWYLGVLGMPGLTAYFGLLDKGKPQTGETVLVSGAAGMVGSLVGQIAKLKGCTVIGIAGSADKCAYIKNELGFDAAIDYKNEDVADAIKAAAPNGVHIYFDNVGGAILDAALLNLAIGARIVVCGAISQYNESGFSGLKNYMKIIGTRSTLMGIIVMDYFSRADEAIADLGKWLKDGGINYKEHIVDGIENYVSTLNMLFTGANNGKLLLKV